MTNYRAGFLTILSSEAQVGSGSSLTNQKRGFVAIDQSEGWMRTQYPPPLGIHNSTPCILSQFMYIDGSFHASPLKRSYSSSYILYLLLFLQKVIIKVHLTSNTKGLYLRIFKVNYASIYISNFYQHFYTKCLFE